VSTPGKRPFWLHQLAEYVIGASLVATGLQSPDPVVPALLGGLVILNAAIVIGPLGAFRWVGRRTHRVLDLVVLGIMAVTVLLGGGDAATRLVTLALGLVLAFLVAGTDYSPPRSPPPPGAPGARGEEIGRAAGRWTAKGVKAVRKHTD
jgi:hypothetical protein